MERHFKIEGVINTKDYKFEDELDIMNLITDLLDEYGMEFSGGLEEVD